MIKNFQKGPPKLGGWAHQHAQTLLVAFAMGLFYISLTLCHVHQQHWSGDVKPSTGRIMKMTVASNLSSPADCLQGGAAALDCFSSSSSVPPGRLPPFNQTCWITIFGRSRLGCFPLSCSKRDNCTVFDEGCCAHLNYQLLLDFDKFMAQKGLSEEYFLTFGSALGAEREKSIIPHTDDIDIALSIKGLMALNHNQTRFDLYKLGYTLWPDRTWKMWRICPHELHPSPVFQAAIADWNKSDVSDYVGPVYIDAYMSWPADPAAEYCNKSLLEPEPGREAAFIFIDNVLNGTNTTAAAKETTGQKEARAANVSVHDDPEVTESAGMVGLCMQFSDLVMLVKPGDRPAVIGNMSFPAPANILE